MIHWKPCQLILIVLVLWSNHPMTSNAKFLFKHKAASFFGRLYKKITVQPKYCHSYCNCGSSNAVNEAAGVQMQPNEYPWVALIYDPNDLTTTYPGTLISSKYVVSAASNFYGKAAYQLKVKLGYHFNCQYEKSSVTFSVSEIIIHPHFAPGLENLGNDIALVKLSSEVHFNHEISPICLPKTILDYNGHVGLLASWNLPPMGQFEMVSTNCSPRKYKLPITAGFKCSEMLSMESESCIGVYGAKSLLCAEDSGAGIFHRKDDRHELIGVLSHRQHCGVSDYGSPLIIKDQVMNETNTSFNSSSTVAVVDLKDMSESKPEEAPKGRQLHTLHHADHLMGGDHYFDPLPVFTRIDYHWDWIVQTSKDSCYCKPRFQFSIKFNKHH